MRRFLSVFLCLLLCGLLVFPAFADEGDSDDAGIEEAAVSSDDSAPAAPGFNDSSEPADQTASDVDSSVSDDGSLPGDDVPAVDPDSDAVSDIPTPEPITDDADFPAIGDYVGYEDALSYGDLISLQASNIGGGSYVYSDPQIIGYDYAPDPEAGTLLAVLYDLIGKPIVATHYRYTTSNSSGNTAYAVVSLDYDMNFLIGCAMIALFVLCLFKLGGGLLCRK